MRTKLLAVLATFLFSISIVIILFFVTNKINHNPNGFIRLLPPHKISPIQHLDIQYNSFYIGGITKQFIYLGNSVAPNKLMRVDCLLTDTQYLNISWNSTINFYNDARIWVDSPFVFLFDGLTSNIFRGNLFDLRLDKIVKSIPYTAGIPLSKNTFLLRSTDTIRGNTMLKQGTDSPRIKFAPNILEKQIDGIFCTDGTLIKLPNSSKIIYIYYYRNQFICVDSNLNLLYRGRTIDTNSIAHIKVGAITTEHQITMTTPPILVNKSACATENWLLVNSALIANNEPQGTLDNLSVIDVYSVKDGKYHFSFYLPNFGGKKVRDFKVFGKTLVALYDHFIYTYQLNF